MLKKWIVASLFVGSLLAAMPYHAASYVAPVKPPLKEYAAQMTLDAFGSGQWVYFERIIHKESGWKVYGPHYPVSKKSTAYGLCGFLNGTWKTTEYTKSSDPYIQVDACIEYVKERYGTPKRAYAFHVAHKWF